MKRATLGLTLVYTSLIFIGLAFTSISHAEIEYARPEDLAAGCNVLLYAVLERAGACRPRECYTDPLLFNLTQD